MADRPPIFALPPGADFPAELVAGLRQRLSGQPPEVMAKVTLILNTQRMRRRVTECLVTQGAVFLPRLMLVTEAALLSDLPLPRPISPLRRRLVLSVLLDRLLATETTHFPRAALYDLADSLAGLIAEMQGEGVPPQRVAALDVANHSAHWARTQAFLGIVTEALAADAPDAETNLRRAVEGLPETWARRPLPGPVILAGSTGSRGTTALLMQAVAGHPQGAIVLPGHDFDLPHEVWAGMDDALTAEDHPQFRTRRLMDLLGFGPQDVQPWTTTPAPDPARNRLISLALRPAPVTDQWLSEGPKLADLLTATEGLTLVEAPTPRAEAMAIALILREAAEAGRRAALISPDRNLTRRVTAALDRWGIRPDDSAGRPLALSAPGRMLRQVAALFGQRLTADALLALLKHPLAFSGADRGQHLILTREFELHIRRNGPAFPTAESVRNWAKGARLDRAETWAGIVADVLCDQEVQERLPLTAFVARHLSLTERLAAGFDAAGAGALWLKEAGEKAFAVMRELQAEAQAAGDLTSADYAGLILGLLNREDVRESEGLHPGIMIWGTLEARAQGAELVILGGLNDGTWPAQPPADPWLNRAMRKEVGLLLPERQIGLSAHDWQQAVAAPRVVLSRARRGAEAETVPSRWLNRMVNLLAGLPDQRGPEALAAMRDRGAGWLRLAQAFDTAPPVEPARRPSPRPPVPVRPRQLSVTQIKTLIRDPYAIYACHVLKLQPLDPLRPEADPRLRGTVLHEILERFLKQGGGDRQTFLALAETVLADRVAWPLARTIWLSRLAKAADAFLDYSSRTGGVPVLLEEKGALRLPGLDFTLTGKPDRIDRLADGRLMLIDYKTGAPPSPRQQEHFDKQLLLLAAMAEGGAFRGLDPAEVARVAYVGLKAQLMVEEITLEPGQVADVWKRFGALMASYARPGQGYTARRALEKAADPGDYDHLSRYGEWEMTDDPVPEAVE
ncbi:double-strand break repair protein AddB [Rhodobacter calidifons]|uniref:Double-strand break repair protein AddB n=1 Tax=Rhodobacter calidifons TaxID=2715277 RepID=A0ABX0G5S2_9RHOB|nr:double-strand break repair protein AddB [Rhodobacter calidifons]NHB76622.1 double-strand break repair protein AddB [Rhodobacter calidifons]